MKISLENQVILVTGASRGIGLAVAKQLAEAGATLALHHAQNRNAGFPIQEVAGKIRWFQADLRESQAGRKLVAEVLEEFGRIDGLVNNAGIALELPEGSSPGAWQQVWTDTLQVNLVAAAEITEAALPGMIARGGGRLVHIASRAAFRGDTPDFAAYAASKGGLVAYSRSIARGYGKQGICSFVVAPGFTETDMARQFLEHYGADFLTKDLALAQLTQPEDVAPTVLFLLSGHMDHATGATIDINAGSYVR